MRKIVILFILWLAAIDCSLAQDKITVSGTVSDASNGETLPGVNVIEKGTSNGTITNIDGKYTVEVSPNATLIFSFVGLKTQEISVNSQANMDVTLESDFQSLDEIVVTGYTEQKKADISGAISVVDVGEAFKEANANPLQSLQGRIPGVTITTDGAPGTNANIQVRGFGSFSGTSPLYIIDGNQTFFPSGLNPNDIESIQVLRDGASKAIYGARAAGGVIIITTKKGKSGELKANVNAFAGVKWSRNTLDMLNARQYGEVLFQAQANDGLPIGNDVYSQDPNTGEVIIADFIDPNQTTPSGDTDWQDEVYQPAYNQSYSVSLSKANDGSNFYLGLNYNREEGLARFTDFERYSIQLNNSFNLFDRVTIGENLLVSQFSRVDIPEPRTLEAAVVQLPVIPLEDNQGNYGGPFGQLGNYLNPVGQLDRNSNNRRRTWRVFGNLYTNINLVKGLDLRTSIGIDYSNARFSAFSPTFTEGSFRIDNNSLFEEQAEDFNTVWTNTLQYAWNNENHDFKVLVGYERVHNTFEFFNTSANGFVIENEEFQFIGAAANRDVGSDGNGGENGLESVFARVDYSLLDRYIFAASIRRDGSSKFGENNRFGVFPAASFAWKIINEDFMSGVDFLSDLKLRVSVGANGNEQSLGNYTFATFFGSSVVNSFYDISGSNSGNQQGFRTVQIGNPNVQWETEIQTNIGLDVGLIENRLYITADYFIKDTEDLLVAVTQPDVAGEGAVPFFNVGDMRNTGFELLVSYRSDYSKEFKYDIDVNVSRYRNEVKRVFGDDEIVGALSRISTGQPIGSFYGFFADGLFRSQAEVDAHAEQPGKAPGRIRFRDINEDGVIDDQDRGFIGDPNPDFSFGINFRADYKGFDLSLFIDGVVGNDIYDNFINFTDFFSNLNVSNHGTQLLNAWTPENPNADIPAVTTLGAQGFENQPSSYFIDDGTFVRLKSIALGYTLPTSLTEKIKISRARIYIQAQNLLNLTAFDGLDYEVLTTSPVDGIGVLNTGAYPHNKSLTLGLNLEF